MSDTQTTDQKSTSDLQQHSARTTALLLLHLTETDLQSIDESCVAACQFFRERVAACQGTVEYWHDRPQGDLERKIAVENLLFFRARLRVAEQALRALQRGARSRMEGM